MTTTVLVVNCGPLPITVETTDAEGKPFPGARVYGLFPGKFQELAVYAQQNIRIKESPNF